MVKKRSSNRGNEKKKDSNKKCSICDDELSESGNYVNCYGCKAAMHYRCSGIKEETWRSKGKEAKENWRCKNCRVPIKDKNKNNGKDMRKTDTEDSSEDESSVTDNENSDYDEKEMELLETPDPKKMMEKINELIRAMNFLNNAYEAKKCENVKLNKELKDLKEEMEQLKDKHKEKGKDIETIQRKITIQEQYERNRNLEIMGVKKTANEDLAVIMEKFATKLKIQNFNSSQIDKMHRIPQKDKSKNENIIVQFKTRSDREDWLRKNKIKITNSDIQEGLGDGRIYINEHLTGNQKYLLWKSRLRAKEQNWKFVWVKEGKILCRKIEGERCFVITTEEEVSNIIAN